MINTVLELTNQHPSEKSSPRKIIPRSICRPQHVHEVLLDSHAGNILPILQLHCFAIFIHQAIISTNFYHGGHHEDEGSNHHEDGLDKVSPDDSRETTTYGEESSNH